MVALGNAVVEQQDLVKGQHVASVKALRNRRQRGHLRQVRLAPSYTGARAPRDGAPTPQSKAKAASVRLLAARKPRVQYNNH